MISLLWLFLVGLRHHFEYTRKSAGEERNGILPNNVRESAFQGTNQAIISSVNFYIF